jgi:hypothetical protein
MRQTRRPEETVASVREIGRLKAWIDVVVRHTGKQFGDDLVSLGAVQRRPAHGTLHRQLSRVP